MDLQASDEESMIRTAVAVLYGRFTAIDVPRIEATVRRHVDELFAQARVKTFVGIIAERRARTELQRTSSPAE